MSGIPKAKLTRPRKLSDVPEWDFETDVAVVGFGGAGPLEQLFDELANTSTGIQAELAS